MEIISFVQQPKKKRTITFPVRPKSYNSVSFAYTYPSEKHIFKAGKVHNDLTVKGCFAALGQGVSDFGSLIARNIKAIVISIFAVLGIAGLGITAFFVTDYTLSHTKIITLNAEDSFDIDTLDSLMKNFALELTSDVDENGLITDSTGTAISASLLSQPVEYQTYKVKSGDTISGIAKKFGLTNISTLISVNDIGNVRQLGAGQKLKIPSIDGIIYTVKAGDSLQKIASSNNIRLESILDVNELTTETLTVGQQLFLPGVGLDQKTLQSRMGELFILPISASFRWSSPYGWRADPFTGVQSFHTGIDMACPEGTPILAAMSGKVADVGYNRTYGNYIIINHGNGYQTLYAHMSKTIATKGQYVTQGTKIGLVGSTGYSTGPHLHFMVYKNGNRIDPMTVLKK
ncbi:MAG: M23 family metallopeptidase [Treponema sp.]|nr:M23 family metallopeptidase [Treponema sp.]